MAQQVKSVVGIVALVLGGGALALLLMQSMGRDEKVPASSSGPPVSAPPAVASAAPEAPIELGSVRVPDVRDYFTSSEYRFEDKPLPGDVARAVGTSPSGQTVLELVGAAPLKQITLRYTLRAGNLNGGDMHAIMHLLQYVKAGEDDVNWAVDAARKGEPRTRTSGAVVYTVQRGPGETNEFVMTPAPGFG